MAGEPQREPQQTPARVAAPAELAPERTPQAFADTHVSSGTNQLGLARTIESEPPPAPSLTDAQSAIPRQLAHHRLDELIGRGGMGSVYRAFDTALERPVAVKVLLPELSNRPESRLRFMREARAQAKVRHPNVVPIHYVGVHDGVAFLSMQLVEGQSVAELLEHATFSPDRAIDIALEVASALEAGWAAGLVHRDVKPSNILLQSDGHVLLADFGLAKAVGDFEAPPSDIANLALAGSGGLTGAGGVVGTPAYMAPEQVRGEPVDHRTDMYALGITLYEMLTGSRPFTSSDLATLMEEQRVRKAAPLRSVRGDVTPRLERVIARLLNKASADRFQTWSEVRQALAAARSTSVVFGGRFARISAMLADVVLLSPLAIVGAFAEVGAIAMALGWAAMVAIWGSSPGKRLLHLKTVDAHGDELTPWMHGARTLLKLWGLLALNVVAFVPDSLFTTVAEAAVPVLWLLGLGVGILPGSRALHDRVFGTRVVYAFNS